MTMFIKQLSVFVENKFGRLEAIIDCLSKNGINLRALSLADTADYGVLRLIADDAEKAKKALNEIGVISKITDVVAVYLDDRAGGLASVLSVLKDADVSIEYMYAFAQGATASIIIRPTNLEKCIEVLSEKQFTTLTQEGLNKI